MFVYFYSTIAWLFPSYLPEIELLNSIFMDIIYQFLSTALIIKTDIRLMPPRNDGDSSSEEQQGYSDSKMSQSDQHGFERKTSPPQRQKNGASNYAIKSNKICGTYGRIIPRKPVHDYEQLYSQNIQLKEKIRNIEDMFMKTKTRLSMLQKQRSNQKLHTKASYISDFSRPNISRGQQRKSLHLQKNSYEANAAVNKRHTQDENRRILHQYQDKIKKLEIENGRLKKTVKYTQIQQIQIQNNYLHQQMAQMKEYMEEVIRNTDYQEYQIEIDRLKKQNGVEKQNTRSLFQRIKKKDEEIEQLKEKIKQLNHKKVDIEKRLTREVSSYKCELNRVRDKQKQLKIHQNNFVEEKKQALSYKRKNYQKTSSNTNSSFHAGNFKKCGECQEKKIKIDELNKLIHQKQAKIGEKNRQIQQMNNKIEQLNHQIMQISKQQQQKQQKNINNITQQQKLPQNKSHKKAQNKEKQIIKSKESQQNHSTPHQNQKQSHKMEQSAQKIDIEQSDDDDYKFEEDDEDHDKMNKSNKVAKEGKDQQKKKKDEMDSYLQYEEEDYNIQQYDDEFGDDQSEEEVLFQKQDKGNKNKKQQKVGQNANKTPKNQEKNSEKKNKKASSTKDEKILQETIKYRLIGQRYTFQDFKRDIDESGATEFGIQDLIQMLTNEPFLLHQQHLQMLLIKLLNKSEFSEEDFIETNKFMKVIKKMFEGVELLDEETQKNINLGINKKMKKKAQIIYSAFESEGSSEQISKKGFIKVLQKKLMLSEQQIQQCLSEASVFSKDIAHINYPLFMESILNPQ